MQEGIGTVGVLFSHDAYLKKTNMTNHEVYMVMFSYSGKCALGNQVMYDQWNHDANHKYHRPHPWYVQLCLMMFYYYGRQ